MNSIAKRTAIAVAVAALGLTAVSVTAGWGGQDRHRGFGGPSGGKAIMLTRGGKQDRIASRHLDLTADEAKILVQARLIMRGNDRLKVGQVARKDEDTFLVDVVTVDDSLVHQVEIDRDSGFRRGPFGAKK